MEVHGRRRDRMMLRRWEKRRKTGSRWGTRKWKETRLLCREQGRKADRSCDWSTEFPLGARHVSRSVCQCLLMPPRGSPLLPVDTAVAFVVGTEITASVVISRVARGEWNTVSTGIYGLFERPAPSRSGEHDEERMLRPPDAQPFFI